jgi:hypothetical protein
MLVKAQHPEIDLRMIFQKENTPVSKDTTLTYGDWANLNGFTWAGRGTVPEAWIEEFRETLH